MYYDSKINSLREIFGTDDIVPADGALSIGGRRYPVIDDVIVLSEPEEYTEKIRRTLNAEKAVSAGGLDRKSTRLNSSHIPLSRMPSSA